MPACQKALQGLAEVDVVDCESEIGSGALPTRTIPSCGLAIKLHNNGKSGSGTQLNKLVESFRALPTPVIGRIQDDTLIFDLRCLNDETAFIAQLEKLELKL